MALKRRGLSRPAASAPGLAFSQIAAGSILEQICPTSAPGEAVHVALFILRLEQIGHGLDLGVQAGVVEKSGSWFSYGGQRIGQGKENARTFLKSNPDMADVIEAKIRENAGLVAGAMMGSPDGDGEPADDQAAP